MSEIERKRKRKTEEDDTKVENISTLFDGFLPYDEHEDDEDRDYEDFGKVEYFFFSIENEHTRETLPTFEALKLLRNIKFPLNETDKKDYHNLEHFLLWKKISRIKIFFASKGARNSHENISKAIELLRMMNENEIEWNSSEFDELMKCISSSMRKKFMFKN